jgi:hypothetical protein
MALKISKFESATVPYKIIHETALSSSNAGTAAVVTNATQGDAGSIISMDINNSWGGGRIYFHVTLNTAAPANTSEADILIPVNASSTVRVVIPQGVPFSNLSFWATQAAAVANTTGPGGAVLVTIITT